MFEGWGDDTLTEHAETLARAMLNAIERRAHVPTIEKQLRAANQELAIRAHRRMLLNGSS